MNQYKEIIHNVCNVEIEMLCLCFLFTNINT